MTVAAILLVALSGTSRTAARPATQPADTGIPRTAMVTGCLSSEKSQSYRLTDVMPPSSESATAFRGGPRLIPLLVAGQNTASTLVSYRLNSPFKLRSQIGQKVEIIGTIDSSSSDSRNAGTLKVRSVRMLNERCQ